MFIGEIDIYKHSFSNNHIRNVILGEIAIYKSLFWSNMFRNMNWNTVWCISDKNCLNNKVKEVTFKIAHGIYPSKSVFEIFQLDIDYSCDFCSIERESIVHLFYNCI